MKPQYTQSAYTKQVLKHSKHPKNWGIIKNADGMATNVDQVCFDQTTAYIKVSKDKKGKEKIKDIRFTTGGCPASVASSSVLSVMMKGKPLEKAFKITQKDILKELKALPEYKIHCAALPIAALRSAIENYQSRAKLGVAPRNLFRLGKAKKH
jgi:nitrogen fixation NifU-like protein